MSAKVKRLPMAIAGPTPLSTLKMIHNVIFSKLMTSLYREAECINNLGGKRNLLGRFTEMRPCLLITF